MEWTTFITSIIGLYGLWYAGNILKDTFSRRTAKAGESVHYDIGDFLNEEESVEVKDSDFYVASETLDLPEVFPEKEPIVQAKKTSVEFEEPPGGQGIPLTEFLKSFKKKSEESAQKIQFT